MVESSKEIPVVHDVDVVVAGGSSGAVAAACEAANQGARVFLLAPRPYLGTDICATLRLWLNEGEKPESALAVACFGEKRIATPSAVKAAMDRALIEAGVSYLTGCCVTDVLCNRDGGLSGIVMANRSGRQAVRAKVVIDATRQAIVARQAKVPFRVFAPGRQTFRRVVIGGAMRSDSKMSADKKDFTCDSIARHTDYRLPVYEYTMHLEMSDNSARSFFLAENLARDMTNGAGQEMASEVLYHLPADTIIAEKHLDDWPGARQADLDAFRPRTCPQLYVLGGYADLSAGAAEKMMRPLELMNTGRRLGQAAAEQAAALPPADNVFLPDSDADGGVPVTIGEESGVTRFGRDNTIRAGRHVLPVLGRYDVVVVGGGTSGAPAGIGAAKSGARTLVVEYLHELGGVGTTGLIAKYWYGVRRGYTAYIDDHVNPGSDSWNAVDKAEWLRRELMRSGAEVWLGALGCGAIIEGNRVCGVIVATPEGRGVVLASTVVDATGNADVAAWAGAQTRYGLSEQGALNVQIAGFPERPMKRYYVNTCFTMVDDTDVFDVWHLMAWKRTAAAPAAFDFGQLVDSRERRRVVGDCTLTVPDILNRRTWPDTICHHYSNFDAAAFPDSPLLLASDAKGPCFDTDMPYRCLLPKGLDGLLVVGLGASVQRDAMTL
ncbi:MAG: FAD-dependent oxidoreductase, partial [Planctomycetes bacterium]|nr:FAD-dependent oxidoreductase [Planctomycetota bacterium]